jgi:hypothetical protein
VRAPPLKWARNWGRIHQRLDDDTTNETKSEDIVVEERLSYVHVPELLGLTGEVTSSKFINFSELRLPMSGLGAFAGGETPPVGAATAGAAGVACGAAAAAATGPLLNEDEGAEGALTLETLMKMLPWNIGRALLSSVTSSHTMCDPTFFKNRKW